MAARSMAAIGAKPGLPIFAWDYFTEYSPSMLIDTPFWVFVAQGVESWVKTGAVVLGGFWILYRFGLGREREPALTLELNPPLVRKVNEDTNLVSFEVTITNTSKVKVAASKDRPAYCDKGERLTYSVSLVLRPIEMRARHGLVVQWFDAEPEVSPRTTDIELDLLNDYSEEGKSDFWMEPGESYQVGASVFLKSGSYLALLTFIGKKSHDDFWRRTTVIEI